MATMSYSFSEKQGRWAESSWKRKMADNPTPLKIKPAPLHFKSKIWAQFGFYTLPGNTELDMTKILCKLSHGQVLYSCNTTNMSAHLAWANPWTKMVQAKQPLAASQWTLDGTLNKLPSGSDKVRWVTMSVTHFICKDLCPYSVVENMGFWNMVYSLEPWYAIKSRRFFLRDSYSSKL